MDPFRLGWKYTVNTHDAPAARDAPQLSVVRVAPEPMKSGLAVRVPSGIDPVVLLMSFAVSGPAVLPTAVLGKDNDATLKLSG